MVRIDRVDDPPMVSTVRVNGNIDAAGTQLTQDMPDTNAATD